MPEWEIIKDGGAIAVLVIGLVMLLRGDIVPKSVLEKEEKRSEYYRARWEESLGIADTGAKGLEILAARKKGHEMDR